MMCDITYFYNDLFCIIIMIFGDGKHLNNIDFEKFKISLIDTFIHIIPCLGYQIALKFKFYPFNDDQEEIHQVKST